MDDSFLLALATLFATVGPVDVAAIYAAITLHASQQEKRRMAWRGVLIASSVLLLFALVGDLVLHTLGISLAALRTAGGIMLLLIGLDMVFARNSGAISTTPLEEAEARRRGDVAVFPLALPLIAGPGTMGAVMLLMAQASDELTAQLSVLAALLSVMLISLLCLLAASRLTQLLGVTGMQVITRVMGVLLCALAVQFVFDGIAGSGLLSHSADAAAAASVAPGITTVEQ
ncbi:MarC family protein [Thalassolituus hydrocarboniclasticus]|uniref:MarC family protein n=1 Tax=Thalassolituus hydrocarboniclasticus TaxID=2742796 RepID=UPI0021B58BB4|nr:MarC family protein [Thalassolituus hydrocarboniclasticus]